jgi:hypothetical protein
MASRKLTRAREDMMDAINAYAHARAEGSFTDGYRAGGHDTTEMQQRSIRQWESVGERKVALDKAIRIYVRTIRQELR